MNKITEKLIEGAAESILKSKKCREEMKTTEDVAKEVAVQALEKTTNIFEFLFAEDER